MHDAFPGNPWKLSVQAVYCHQISLFGAGRNISFISARQRHDQCRLPRSFRAAAIPPQFEPAMVACILCSRTLKELAEVVGTQRPPARPQAANGGQTAGRRGRVSIFPPKHLLMKQWVHCTVGLLSNKIMTAALRLTVNFHTTQGPAGPTASCSCDRSF